MATRTRANAGWFGVASVVVVALLCTLLSALPAEAVTSPWPLNCAIGNGQCGPLSGVGSLTFGGTIGTLTVSYQQAGEKIVGGDQLALNLTGVTGNVLVTGTGITGSITVPIGSYRVAGCVACFNFDIVNGIAPNLPAGTSYTFTLTNLGLNGASSVVAGGPLSLGAAIHLSNIDPANANSPSVFAGETVPEPGTLGLFGIGLVGVSALFGTQLLNRGRKELV